MIDAVKQTILTQLDGQWEPPHPPLKGDFSYLWADFAEIWNKWPSHQWEMTETVELIITHIFRPTPLPRTKLYFSYLRADFGKIWH